MAKTKNSATMNRDAWSALPKHSLKSLLLFKNMGKVPSDA